MKKLLYIMFISLLGLFFVNTVFAQGGIVEGTVIDSETNKWLHWANVSVVGEYKWTTNWVATNSDGKFKINITGPNTTLEFSFIGYETIRKNITPWSTVDIILTESSVPLDEVVVTPDAKLSWFIMNEAGDPLAWVNVLLDWVSKSKTDERWYYGISSSIAESGKLEFSLDGYETETKRYNKRKTKIDITLKEDGSKKEEDKQETWLNIDEECLINGQCSMSVNQILGIDKWSTKSFGVFIQDVILWATMFFGTILTVAIIISGIMFISAGAKWDSGWQTNAKKLLTNSIIGFVLVISSYGIIRLIQFLATGGGW